MNKVALFAVTMSLFGCTETTRVTITNHSSKPILSGHILIGNLGYEKDWWDEYELPSLQCEQSNTIAVKVAGHVVSPEIVWYDSANRTIYPMGHAFMLEPIWKHDSEVGYEITDAGAKRTSRTPRY